jgi:hypothetical protein
MGWSLIIAMAIVAMVICACMLPMAEAARGGGGRSGGSHAVSHAAGHGSSGPHAVSHASGGSRHVGGEVCMPVSGAGTSAAEAHESLAAEDGHLMGMLLMIAV